MLGALALRRSTVDTAANKKATLLLRSTEDEDYSLRQLAHKWKCQKRLKSIRGEMDRLSTKHHVARESYGAALMDGKLMLHLFRL
jgi:hypothetical protein